MLGVTTAEKEEKKFFTINHGDNVYTYGQEHLKLFGIYDEDILTDDKDDMIDITNQCEFKVFQWLDGFVRIAINNPFPKQPMPLPMEGLMLDEEWKTFHKTIPTQYYINLLLLADYFAMEPVMEAMHASIAHATRNLGSHEIQKVCYTKEELENNKKKRKVEA